MISGLICIGIGALLGFGIASVLATGGGNGEAYDGGDE